MNIITMIQCSIIFNSNDWLHTLPIKYLNIFLQNPVNEKNKYKNKKYA